MAVNNFVIALGLCINFISSLSIVGVNKYLYSIIKFPNITLTCIHFIITFIGLLICLAASLFTWKKLQISDMVPISLTFCGFVALTNISLQFNTVGTYQLLKTLTTPCIMLIETLFYGKHFSWPIRLTFLPVLVGVTINSYYDVRFNIYGTCIALCGVLVTSLYQILIGAKQADLEANSMQLLFYQAPLSAAMLCVVIPFHEPVIGAGGLLSAQWSSLALGMVVLSGVIAFSVNLSIYWTIGATSALTYNMLGHLKFCATVILGYVAFNDPISFNQFIGMLITFSGVVLYSVLKLREQSKAKAEKPPETK